MAAAGDARLVGRRRARAAASASRRPRGFAQTGFTVHVASVHARDRGRSAHARRGDRDRARAAARERCADASPTARTAPRRRSLIELASVFRNVVAQRSVTSSRPPAARAGWPRRCARCRTSIAAAIVIGGAAGAAAGAALRVAALVAGRRGSAGPARHGRRGARLGVGPARRRCLARRPARAPRAAADGRRAGPARAAGIPAVLARDGRRGARRRRAAPSVADLRVMGGAIAAAAEHARRRALAAAGAVARASRSAPRSSTAGACACSAACCCSRSRPARSTCSRARGAGGRPSLRSVALGAVVRDAVRARRPVRAVPRRCAACCRRPRRRRSTPARAAASAAPASRCSSA